MRKLLIVLIFLLIIPSAFAQWINITKTNSLYDAAGSGSIDDTRFFDMVNWSDNLYLFIGSLADDYANVYNVTSGSATLLISGTAAVNPYSLDGMRAVTVDDRGLAYWCASTDDTITVTNHTFLMQNINTSWYNVSNYTSASGAGSVDGCYFMQVMKRYGGYYLIVASFDDNQITVLNYTNPTTPTAITNWSSTLPTACPTQGVRPFAVDNNTGLIYTAGYSNSTLGVLNFTGSSLTCINSVYNTTRHASINYIVISGGFLYTTNEGPSTNGLSIYNYTSNGSLDFMSFYPNDTTSNYSITLPQSVQVENNITYVSRRGSTDAEPVGFVVFNTTDKYTPVPVGYYNTSVATKDMNFTRDMRVNKGRVYLYSSNNDTFLIINGTFFNDSSGAVFNPCSYSGTGNYDITQSCNITTAVVVQSGFNWTISNNSIVYKNVSVSGYKWKKISSGWLHHLIGAI